MLRTTLWTYYGVPQGSVLRSLLLITSFPVNHHLYADDTRLFLSFQASDFNENISHLQNALGDIASWMTSNLLCFNSAKTEFLLVGIRPQLNKIHNPVLLFNNGTSVSPAASARNLDSHLTFEDQISSVSRACFYHIRDLRRIRSVINSNTAKTIGTSFVHSRLDFCNSLYNGLPHLVFHSRLKTHLFCRSFPP